MKKITYIFLSILLLGHVTSCKKFLDVVPIDNLAGNSFWQNKEDVEAFTLGVYNKLRATTMTETRFFPVTGDLRCAPVFVISEHANSNQFIVYLKNNNL